MNVKKIFGFDKESKEKEQSFEEFQKELCGEIKDFLDDFLERTSEQRAEARDCQRHMGGEHFSETMKQKRKNRVNLIKNDAPMTKRKIQKFWKKRESQLKFHASTEDEYKKNRSRILQGLGSHIERNSQSQKVQSKAFENLLDCGMGAFYVDADWSKSTSKAEKFNQEITIRPIKNPFFGVWDLDSIETDRSDAMRGGFYFQIPLSEYQDEFGEDEKPKNVTHDEYIEPGDKTVLCFRYYKKIYEKELVVLAIDWRDMITTKDGEEIMNPNLGSEIVINENQDKVLYNELMSLENSDTYILDEREDYVSKIYYWEVTGDKIISEDEEAEVWGGTQIIPVVPMLGEEYTPNEQTKWASCIRWQKDPDEAYDYMLSSMAEEVSTSSKTKWMGLKEQFAGLAKYYKRSASENIGYIPYNPIRDKKTGQIIKADPPQRVAGAEVPTGWLAAMAALQKDKEDTRGIQPEAMGAGTGGSWGKDAVIARSNESMDTAEPFYDARIEAMEQLAAILREVIPVYYDSERVVRIMGEGGKDALEKINADDFNKISGLEIDVYVDTGPSFNSQRKEENAGLLALMEKMPEQMATALAPFAVDGTDWRNSKEISTIIKKLVGPELYDNGEEQTPEMQQQMLQQLQVKMKQITEENESLRSLLNSNQLAERERTNRAITVENIKADNKIQTSKMDNATDILLQELKGQQEMTKNLASQMADITSVIQSLAQKIEKQPATTAGAQSMPGITQTTTTTATSEEA